MSIPEIPGYTTRRRTACLSSLWDRPAGDYPDVLWPLRRLHGIDPSPSEWLVVVEHFFNQDEHADRGCVLVPAGTEPRALNDTDWIGSDLGGFSVWGSSAGERGFDTGLALDQDDARIEFFLQARKAVGSPLPQIDVSHPFLWLWDAFEAPDGWRYVNAAGREQGLIRYVRNADAWKVEVRIQEFRTFLKHYRKSAIVQVDFVTQTEVGGFERVDSSFRNGWVNVDFHAVADGLPGTDRPAFSRVVGKYVIGGRLTARRPRWEESGSATRYPAFVYGTDPESGGLLTHTCNPAELGTYFDKDASRLHYLTPVYFRREVLQDYVAEPGRYEVTPFRLSCFSLWGVDISINSAGLVEVYLGDIGSKIPPEDWGHWRTHNVPPEGRMEEGRFRRDFLNQWAESPDPIGDLRRARDHANATACRVLGSDLWRPLPADLQLSYRSLMGPLSDDESALIAPLLLIAKVFVDGLDSSTLKKAVPDSEKGEKSLSLLRALLLSLGDGDDSSRVLRDLYAVRSRGGVAHLSNSDTKAALAGLGIELLGPVAAFEKVVGRVTQAVTDIDRLLTEAANRVDDSAP